MVAMMTIIKRVGASPIKAATAMRKEVSAAEGWSFWCSRIFSPYPASCLVTPFAIGADTARATYHSMRQKQQRRGVEEEDGVGESTALPRTTFAADIGTRDYALWSVAPSAVKASHGDRLQRVYMKSERAASSEASTEATVPASSALPIAARHSHSFISALFPVRKDAGSSCGHFAHSLRECSSNDYSSSSSTCYSTHSFLLTPTAAPQAVAPAAAAGDIQLASRIVLRRQGRGVGESHHYRGAGILLPSVSKRCYSLLRPAIVQEDTHYQSITSSNVEPSLPSHSPVATTLGGAVAAACSGGVPGAVAAARAAAASAASAASAATPAAVAKLDAQTTTTPLAPPAPPHSSPISDAQPVADSGRDAATAVASPSASVAPATEKIAAGSAAREAGVTFAAGAPVTAEPATVLPETPTITITSAAGKHHAATTAAAAESSHMLKAAEDATDSPLASSAMHAGAAAHAAAVEDLRKRVFQAASSFKSPLFRQYFERRAREDFEKMQRELPTAKEDDVQRFLRDMEAHCALLQRQSKVANIYHVDEMVYLK